MSDEQKVIKILGLVNGGVTPFDGQYVVAWDPSRDVLVSLQTTSDVDKATRYTVEGAFELWRAVDPRDPVRPDGKPNRPLTAFSVEICPPGQAVT